MLPCTFLWKRATQIAPPGANSLGKEKEFYLGLRFQYAECVMRPNIGSRSRTLSRAASDAYRDFQYELNHIWPCRLRRELERRGMPIRRGIGMPMEMRAQRYLASVRAAGSPARWR